MLFLKYLDDLEHDRATSSELTGKSYTPIIDQEYQWSVWAAPKLADGKIDHNALTGDDFVNGKLFPFLKKFKLSAENADTIEYKIGEIFSELKNRIQSGYNTNDGYSPSDRQIPHITSPEGVRYDSEAVTPLAHKKRGGNAPRT